MTRVNAWILKPWSAYERLDPHCGEVLMLGVAPIIICVDKHHSQFDEVINL